MLVSCNEEKVSENSVPPPDADKLLTKPTGEIVLNITTNFDSNLLWIRGKVLNFRLYNDDYVEFDDIPLESTTGKQLIAKDAAVRKQIKIDKAKTDEINNILSSSEFQKLKKQYAKVESSCDAVPQVTIKNRNKIIDIVWCDNLSEPKNSSTFPKIVSKLLKLTRQIKDEAIQREVYSP